MDRSDPWWRESEFRRRRARVLRGSAGVYGFFAAGLLVLVAVRPVRPDLFDPLAAVVVLGTAAAGLALWRTLRRDWRCPACSARWDFGEALASLGWNHCPSCGAALLAVPKTSERERAERTKLALEAPSAELLAARLRRSRRRAGGVAAAAVVAGVAALAWGAVQGWGARASQAVGIALGAVVLAALAHGSRCPRCRTGLIAGAAGHCQRCGFAAPTS